MSRQMHLPSVCVEQPGTKDGLGQNVKHSVSDDLLVDRHVTSSISETPDDRVGSPDEQSESTNGKEEASDLAGLGLSSSTAVDSKLPDDYEVGQARNGVPAPLLGCALVAVRGEETSEDHDNVGNNGNQDLGTV